MNFQPAGGGFLSTKAENSGRKPADEAFVSEQRNPDGHRGEAALRRYPGRKAGELHNQ